MTKAELKNEQALKKASNKMLNAVMLFRQYNSDACWKGDPKVASKNMRGLNTKVAKREALKTNISM